MVQSIFSHDAMGIPQLDLPQTNDVIILYRIMDGLMRD
jgi:hypothetical protein